VNAVRLGSAQDHKRVGDGDTGPNTGGMGSYSPVPAFPPELEATCFDRFIKAAVAAMARRGTPFRGILYAGLMLTKTGPKLIEFNARFGDPECQVLLLKLRGDLLPALIAACDGELGGFDLRWRDQHAVGVVMAARGYPDRPEAGSAIRGLGEAGAEPGVMVFHAGTRADADGTIRAQGGRVLTVCASARDLTAARDAAYRAIARIDWPEGFCRRDIGWRALGGGR
jgi:phosphoribosylamine--glycine ligase